MIEEVGTVKSTSGGMAIVSVARKSACDGCTSGTCKQEEQSMEIEAVNQAGAVAGEKVRVSIKSIAYMKGSLVVYGVPALGLVIGAVIGKELLSSFVAADADVLSAVSGFVLFGISLIIVKFWTNSASKNIESKPVIEEILR